MDIIKILVMSKVQIDIRNPTFLSDKFRIDLIPYIVVHLSCQKGILEYKRYCWNFQLSQM